MKVRKEHILLSNNSVPDAIDLTICCENLELESDSVTLHMFTRCKPHYT